MSQILHVLQAARLKGRPSESDLAAAAGLADTEISVVVESLIAAGEVERVGIRVKLTTAGRARLDTLLAAERAAIDQALLRQRYHDFDDVNTDFKQLVTDWQLIDGVRPNDHTDAEYDARIVARLADLHVRFAPLLATFIELAPRLSEYPNRFASAVEKVQSGDPTWFARPLIDSYHTVWFELHEELIGLAGLSRVREAAAGRAE
ncbi:MarR family transcriptional regulator [Nocardia australiensis]|uniref:MarR family transcriptional regulator n=1 Tax=Nocardia australiensis TaxID=2887191 RepID=UPI001D135F81|nr:MarR family transcriptional regulator [Nocardia australiensis]